MHVALGLPLVPQGHKMLMWHTFVHNLPVFDDPIVQQGIEVKFKIKKQPIYVIYST